MNEILIEDISLDDNEIMEETISGENDVEYAEFSMTQRMPPDSVSSNSVMEENVAIDEELMLLSLFTDSPSNTGVLPDTSTSSTHSCMCFASRCLNWFYLNFKRFFF